MSKAILDAASILADTLTAVMRPEAAPVSAPVTAASAGVAFGVLAMGWLEMLTWVARTIIAWHQKKMKEQRKRKRLSR